MAAFSGKGTTNDSYTLELSVWEDSYSVSNNTSKVKWQLTLYSTGYDFASHTLKWMVQIDGNTLRDKTEGNGYLYPATLNKNSSLVLDSGELTITHESNGKKSIYCYVDFESTVASYMPGAIYLDGILPLTDIPRYANFTEHYVNSTGLNSITINWNADATCDYVQYSLNGGSWINTGGLIYTISGLSPNTQYNIRTKIRRADSQLWTESSYIYGTTKDIAKVTSAYDFNLGDNAKITISNPSGESINYFVETLNPTKALLEKKAVVGENVIEFTQEELDTIYKKMGTANSITLRLGVATKGSYWHWLDKTCTLRGNQKTGHVNVNNSWKRTKKWVNVNNSWKRCIRWENINGTWKRCI